MGGEAANDNSNLSHNRAALALELAGSGSRVLDTTGEDRSVVKMLMVMLILRREHQTVMLQMRTAATNATMPNKLAEAIASPTSSRICSPGGRHPDKRCPGPAGGRGGDGGAGGNDGGSDGTGGGGGGSEGGEGGRLGGEGGRLGGSGGSEGSGGGGGMGGLK